MASLTLKPPVNGNTLNLCLLERYALHYQQMNRNVVPTNLTQRQRRSMERTLGHLVRQLPAGSRVVDVGCGPGQLLQWLSGYRNLVLTGGDQSEQQLAVTRESLGNVELLQMDGLEYLLSNAGRLSGIFCFDVLEHIDDDHRLSWMETAASALASGGFLCCRCPNAANLLAGDARYANQTPYRMVARTALIQLFEAAGLESIETVLLRPKVWGAAAQLRVEAKLHRMLFHVSGRRPEPVITTDICIVGRTRCGSSPHHEP